MENKKILAVFFSVLLFLIPLTASAGLVPCANSDNPEPCTLCHLIVGFWNLINYGFKILVFVALTGLVIAGIMYIVSAGNEEMIKTAKGFIKNILFGFGIVLLAWVLIFTVMNYFGVKPDLGLGLNKGEKWNKFECSTQSTVGEKWADTNGNGDDGDGYSGTKGKFYVSYPSLSFKIGDLSYIKSVNFYVNDNSDQYSYECSIEPSDKGLIVKMKSTSSTECQIKGAPDGTSYALKLSATPKSGSDAPSVEPYVINFKASN